MRKIFFLLLISLVLINNIFANELRKKAEESPLECAFYLLHLENKKDRGNGNIEDLARAFFDVKRYDDVLRTLKYQDNNYTKLHFLSEIAYKLIEQGKNEFANKFLDEAIEILRNGEDEDWEHDGVMPKVTASFAALNREIEIIEILEHQEDKEYKAKIQVAVAEAYLKAGKSEVALRFAEEVLNDSGLDGKTFIAQIYAKLNQDKKAIELLDHLEKNDFVAANEAERNGFIHQNIFVRLKLGQTDKAYEFWQQHRNFEDKYDVFVFTRLLLENGQSERALPYLLELENDKEWLARNGDGLAEMYLKLDEVEKALSIAKTMSTENDNYDQQRALMLVADRYIANGKTDAAIEILDFAFQKAKKIVYVQEPQYSNWPGIRKREYLGQIYQRLMKLKQYEKAYLVFNSVGKHPYAERFIAESLVDFIGHQINTMSKKRIDATLSKAEAIFKGEDKEYYPNKIRISAAKIYSRMGERAKAVDLLAKVLEEAKESCCYQDDFLLLAGKVFEEHQLKSNPRMKKILKEIIEEAEE